MIFDSVSELDDAQTGNMLTSLGHTMRADEVPGAECGSKKKTGDTLIF